MPFYRVLGALRLLTLTALSFTLLACGGMESDRQSSQPEVALKTEPDLNEELTLSPGSLRVYFSKLPDVAGSSMSLTGSQGEIPLSGLHTMGENDLMIGIDQYPLPAGQYTVHWTTRFDAGGPEFSGSYDFSIKAEQP